MFDNLRDSAESSSFYEEEQNDLYKEPVEKAASKPKSKSKQKRRTNARFLGMTAQQRFFVSLMILFTVCIMGALLMFVTGAMSFF
jgi:hypothetical protein